MMKRAFLGTAAAAMLAASMNFLPALPLMRQDPVHALRRSGGKRRRTGWLYPHSSARQQARYARQLAAGQLSMEGARP